MASTMQATLRTEQRLAATLAMVAGYVDAYGLLNFQTYLSFMSGNTTQTGSQLGQVHLALALPSAIAILAFVIGVFSGTLITHSGQQQAQRLLYGAVAALIAIIVVASVVWSPGAYASIAVLSLAMGIMNTTLSRVGAQAVNIGFVTGTLNHLADHLALAFKRVPLPDAAGPWDTHLRRALVLLGVWAAFLTGALLSGLLTSRLGVQTLLLPFLVLITLTALNPSGSPNSPTDS